MCKEGGCILDLYSAEAIQVWLSARHWWSFDWLAQVTAERRSDCASNNVFSKCSQCLEWQVDGMESDWIKRWQLVEDDCHRRQRRSTSDHGKSQLGRRKWTARNMYLQWRLYQWTPGNLFTSVSCCICCVGLRMWTRKLSTVLITRMWLVVAVPEVVLLLPLGAHHWYFEIERVSTSS